MARKKIRVRGHRFSDAPAMYMKRTKFDRSHVYKTTFDSGKLIPVFIDEVLPGDTTRMSVNYFARLATPIKPIMDNIYLDWFFFFVPNRLVWEHWQNFCFEQEDPDDSTDFVIPTVSATGNSENAYIGSLWDYFGLPVNTSGNLSGISALPFRGVYLIWNEWFRDENLQKSVKIQKGDTNEVLNSSRASEQPSWVFTSDTNIVPGLACPPRGKRHDYFTSALPWTQKGPGVSIGLAGTASIVDPTPGTGYLLHSTSNQLAAVSAYGGDASSSGGYRKASGAGSISFNRGSGSEWSNVGGFAGNSSDSITMSAQVASTYLGNDSYVDLDTSSIFTINSLRTAFQMQKFYERLARGGSRYTEVLRSFFGVVSPDARLQRPEFLGSFTKMVNVNPIAQTSATDITFLNAATVNQTLKSIVLQVMKHLLNTIITNIFHPVRMRFIKFFVIITRRTHLFAVDNNIIIGIAFFAMIFEPFSTYAGTIGSNHEFRNATFIVRRSVFTCLLFNYITSDIGSRIKTKLANKMHTVFPYLGKTRRSVSIITVCTEPKNFVIKINIKQNVMIMGTNMKFTIFTTAEKANTAAILTAKIFHESLMKFLA
nr:MAG: major capsid protein [Microviridae sp.]